MSARLGYDPFSGPHERTVVATMTASDAEHLQALVALKGPDGVIQGRQQLTSTGPNCDEPLAASAELAISIAINPLSFQSTAAPPSAAPVPTSSTLDPGWPISQRCRARRQSAVVACVPVPNAIPGSSTSRAPAPLAGPNRPRWRHHQVPEAHRMEVLLPALLPGLGGHEFHRSGIDLEALPERGARHLGLVLGGEVADQLHCSSRHRRDPRRRQFPIPAHLDARGTRQVEQARGGIGQASGDPEFQAEGGILGQGGQASTGGHFAGAALKAGTR